MIYEPLKETLLTLLRAPTNPPEPPAGSRKSVRTFRAAPNFLNYRLIVMGVGVALIGAGEGISLFVSLVAGELLAVVFLFLLALATLVTIVLAYFLIRLDYDMRYYIVTDRSLRIREGALIIHEATFTFANIQNLSIHQGPIERLLGISNLEVHTAGGASPQPKERTSNLFHHSVLRGIGEASKVRDEILVLLKKYRDAGLGDPEDRRRALVEPRTRGFSAAALERLREIRAELQLLKTSL